MNNGPPSSSYAMVWIPHPLCYMEIAGRALQVARLPVVAGVIAARYLEIGRGVSGYGHGCTDT